MTMILTSNSVIAANAEHFFVSPLALSATSHRAIMPVAVKLVERSTHRQQASAGRVDTILAPM